MTKPEIIKEIKMNGPIILSHEYLYSLDMDKLKELYEKYVPKIKAEKGK
jgi:hypothetical protein